MTAIIAALLNAVLADAVVETFERGSSVRWLVLAIVAAYAAVTALLWRRWSWQRSAVAAGIALGATFGSTAWVPGGIDNGVGILGLSTSTLLSLTVAAAIALAAVVLSRMPRLPREVERAIYVLAAYGVVACLAGAAAGVPLTSLLSGQSLWKPLPAILQGAVIGSVIVLPLGLVAAVVRAGLRRPAEGTRAREIQEIAALATACAIVAAAAPFRDNGALPLSVAVDSLRGRPEKPATPDAAARLDSALAALETQEREVPRDRWDPAYVVEQLGTDPLTLVRWVRENTFWIPYQGVLRGPVGVLMDRQGNSLDRALLLGTLLEKAGYTIRLAHGTLAREQAVDLLRTLTPNPDTSNPTQRLERNLETAAIEYRLDDPAIAPGLRAQAQTMKRVLSELDARVSDQTSRLLRAVGTHGDADQAPLESALAALRDHWWIQMRSQDRWRDFDLLAPEVEARVLANTGTEVVEPFAIGQSLRHEIAVRVIVERWSDGTLSQSPVLEQVLQVADTIGKPVILQFWPTAWPARMAEGSGRELLATALQQREWAATFVVGTERKAQATIRDSADAPAATGGSPLGGLGRGIAGALGQRDAEPTSTPGQQELTAVWIEYEIRVPGRATRVVRRPVVDLIGARARSAGAASPVMDRTNRLTRSLSLMMRTEILPLGCQIAPEFVMHLSAQSLIANRDLLRSLTGIASAPNAFELEQLIDRTAPTVTRLYTLAQVRLDWNQNGDRLYMDRPNILTTHRYPVVSGDGVAIRDATDIVANEVGVDLSVRDPFVARLQQGVLDTNAEALLQTGGDAVSNTASAFAASKDWAPVTVAESGTLRLPGDASAEIEADLRAGRIVVAPQSPAALNGNTFAGWWRIDAKAGDTLGVAPNGWGQAMVESGLQNNLFVRMAKTFVFDYAFCQAVPLALNQTVALIQKQQYVPTSLLVLPQVRDPAAVYQENKRACLIGAMITTGITATLPLVMMTLRARQVSRLQTGFCFVAGTLVATAAGPVPIDHVRVGTLVLSENPVTGERAYKRVSRLIITLARPVLALTFRTDHGSAAIEVTREHRFWVDEAGWVRAGDLRPGDQIATRGRSVFELEAIELRPRTTVYNLEVDDFHTYFAGEAGALVHNMCAAQKAPFKDVWIKRSLFRDLKRLAGEPNFLKFVAAMDKGLVGKIGESGVKKLALPVRGYAYELKIGGSAARLLGRIDENGILVFEEFVAGGLH